MGEKERLIPVLIIISCVLHQVIAQGNIRLSGSNEPLQGRVEIQHNGDWGTICAHDGWGLEEADVICRQLGLPQALYTDSVSGDILPGFGSGIYLSNVDCSGNEESITDCQGPPIGTENTCNHYDDVVVICALPGYVGCYRDVPDTWTLLTSHQSRLTTESCLQSCRGDYAYAAMSQGRLCWCGNDRTIGGQLLSPDECNTPCVGNDKQFCGGTDMIDGQTSLTSIYSADLDGALANPYLQPPFNPLEGRLASPSFPGPYSTTRQWSLRFQEWVILAIHLPFFDLNPQDLLNFSGYAGDVERLSGGGGGAPVYFEMGPLRHLDLTLAVNENFEMNALGFLIFYQASPTSAPPTQPIPLTTPISITVPTTRYVPPPTSQKPPPPPATVTTPPPPITLPPPPPITTQPPVVTTNAPTTKRATTQQSTTRPIITTEKSTTREAPTTPPMTTKRSTTPSPPPPDVTTVRTNTMMSTMDDGRKVNTFFLTAWLEFWTFVCVSLFVVGLVMISLICWKSGKWKWLQRGKRYRHRVIHRHHSNHSSWSDHYNYSFKGEDDDHPHRHPRHHKHRLHNGGLSGASSFSSINKHRRHRRHSSHSSYSSTCTPASIQSLSSKSSASSHSDSHSKSSRSSKSSHSSSSNEHGSRQNLIYPNNHDDRSYPGIVYDTGHPGQPPRAYPMYPPQYQDDSHLSSNPPTPPSVRYEDDNIPLQPSPFISVLPEPSTENDFTVPRVTDDYSGSGGRSSSSEGSPNQHRKLSSKRGSTTSNKSSGRKSSFKGFGFRRSSKNKESDDRRENVIEEQPPADVFTEEDLDQIFMQDPPIYVDEDECGPGIPSPPPPPPLPTQTRPSYGIAPGHMGEEYCPPPEGYRPVPQPPVSMGDGTIIPDVEPYIMAESNSRNDIKSTKKKHRKSSKKQNSRSSSVDSGKSGKRFGIFGKSKKNKSSKHQQSSRVSEEPDGGVISEEDVLEEEIEDVLSGLEETIQQAEHQYAGGNSVSGNSDVNGRARSGLDNPLYRGSSSLAGSELGSPAPPFGVVGSDDGEPIDYVQAPDAVSAKDFISPGEGDDLLPDDLDMFGGGTDDNYIPPPPDGPPPAPPHVATDEFWTPLN